MSIHLDRAERKYTKQPFEEIHHKTQQFCMVLAYLSQLIGAVLASYYTYTQIGLSLLPDSSSFQTLLAVITTIFILLTLESFKRLFITIGFRKHFKKYILLNRQNFMVIITVFALLCICISVLTSYKGAELYTTNLNDKSQLIKTHLTKERDQVLLSINEEITSKKRKLKALEHREQKRRWGLTDNEAKSLHLTYQNITSLKSEKKAVYQAYNEKILKALKAERNKFNQSLWPIIVFAALLELITIGCIGFMEFFDVQIIKEQNQVSIRSLENKYPDLIKALRKNKIRNRPVPIKSFVYQYGVSESTLKRLNRQIDIVNPSLKIVQN